MRVKKSCLVILFGALALLPACIMLDIPWNIGGPAPAEFHKVVNLESGGTVQVENAAGDVEIRGWDESRVEITAEQEGGPSSGWSRFARSSLRPEPQVTVDAASATVTIRTPGPRGRDVQPVVHYLISVPRSVKLKDIRVGRGSVIVGDVYGELKVSLREGDLTVENFSGSIEASVINGSVEAEVLDLRAGDKIVIGIDRGDITLALEKSVGAKLEAEASRGTAGGDFDLKGTADGHKLSAVLGDGRAVVNLKALDGDIRLEKAD